MAFYYCQNQLVTCGSVFIIHDSPIKEEEAIYETAGKISDEILISKHCSILFSVNVQKEFDQKKIVQNEKEYNI